jgi:hypothetical protein
MKDPKTAQSLRNVEIYCYAVNAEKLSAQGEMLSHFLAKYGAVNSWVDGGVGENRWPACK